MLDLHAILEALRYERYKLVWIVGAETDEAEAAIRQWGEAHRLPRLALGEVLPPRLMNVPPRRRPLVVDEVLHRLLDEATPGEGPVLLLRLQVLFEPSLKIHPHDLLRDLSRFRPLIAVWPGKTSGRTFSYGEYGHPEHREIREAVGMIVTWPPAAPPDGSASG